MAACADVAVRGDDRIRVVVADDTPDIRLLLRIALETAGGFEVVGEAGDGVEVAELVNTARPDAVVLDLAMPAVDGLQAIEEIRAHSPHTRIVVLSGFTARQMSPTALARGADAYLEKGTAFTELCELLRALCEPVPRATPRVIEEPADGSDLAGTRRGPQTPRDALSFLAHELATPLTVIRGFASTLASGVERMERPTIVASCAAIERQVIQLTRLITDLAEGGEIERGVFSVRPETVDVRQFMSTVIEDSHVVTDPHPVHLNIDVDAAVTGWMDTARIREVLGNLLSNAAKFSPPEAAIEVRVEARDGCVVVSVTDRGRGIPRGREDELFGKFSRLDARAPGTGLGLFLSRGIARAHGGDLVFQRAPHAGSRFILTLPSGTSE